MDKNVSVPESMVSMLFGDINALHGMLTKMISMYQLESELKKHHKAYLHVRDEADEMCKVYSCALQAMQKRWFASMVEQFGTEAFKKTENQEAENGVMMSVDSFNNILDDTLCLTECVDALADNLEGLVGVLTLPDDLVAQYMNICNSTRAVADDVLERWIEMGENHE